MIKKILLLPVLIVGLAACNKKEATSLNFNISADKTEIKAGDTVTFTITGNPEQLTFYSGEKSHNYEYRDRVKADGIPQLSFTSYRQYGTQENTLSLLASSDFSGTYTAQAVSAATWTDITNKAKFSTGADNTPSGTIDLSDLKSDKPVFLAFRFIGSTASTQRTWTIKNFVLNNLLPDGNLVAVTSQADAGWVSVNMNNSPRNWTSTTSQLQFQGGVAGIGNNEGWAITKALYFTKVTPDRGVALKNMSTRMDSYQYVYTLEGPYTATFVASNVNEYGSNSDVKQVAISVQPH